MLHIIFPPNSVKVIASLAGILAFLKGIDEWLHWFRGYEGAITLAILSLMAIFYIVSIWLNSYNYYMKFLELQHKNEKQLDEIKKIKENRDGLLNQFSIYKDEIKDLKSAIQLKDVQIGTTQRILNLIIGILSPNQINKAKKLKEVSEDLITNDRRKENRQDNEDRKNH